MTVDPAAHPTGTGEAGTPGTGQARTPDTGAEHVRATDTSRVVTVRSGDVAEVDDRLVGEEPLEIRACGPGESPTTVATTMRTPGHEAELAVGLLFAEGLLGPGQVERITFADPRTAARPDDTVTVHLTVPLDLDAVAERYAVATASCGVCGRASIDALTARCAPVVSDLTVGWSTLARLPDRLRDAQAVFETTGGLHATGVFTARGELVTLREDVGRHNALDAAIGAHVLAGEVPLADRIVVLSGRVGFELVQKAAAAGVPVVAAVGAPSDLAVRTAEQFGITVVGFLRGGNGNLYSRPDRVDLTA